MFRPQLLACLLLVAAPGFAATLGYPRGQVVIGRSLDVSIPFTLDDLGNPESQCVSADVLMGDTPVSGSQITARLDAASGLVRVQTRSAINEPIVTLTVRLGCQRLFLQTFVLLAQASSDTGQDRPALVPRAPAALPPAAPAPAARSALVVGPAPAPKAAPAAVVAKTQPKPTAKPAAVVQAVPDPGEPAGERDPVLRISSELATGPATTPAQQAQAAAVWKALNSTPEDVAREREQARSEAARMREAALKSSTATTQMRAELDLLKVDLYTRNVVLGLAALLAAALLLVTFLWLRDRKRQAAQTQGLRPAWADGYDGSKPLPTGTPVAPPTAGHIVDVDISLASQPTPLTSTSTAAQPSSMGGFSAFGASQLPSTATTQVQDLDDIQHQVDFFMALGDHGQAIRLLQGYIEANPQGSLLAWLDLLNIFHKQKLRDDYEKWSWHFSRVFNAKVPPFDEYEENGAGLEGHASALARLTALWPSPKVLDVIEEALLRKPSDDGEVAFDLSTYRDLLLLYNIGREVIRGDDLDSGFTPDSGHGLNSESPSTDLSPLTAEHLDSQLQRRAEVIPEPNPGSIDFELDLDIAPGPAIQEVQSPASPQADATWTRTVVIDANNPPPAS